MKTRRLRLEPLEKRIALDGNVLATVDGGNLVVEGDHLGNGVEISPGENLWEYRVAGTTLGGTGSPTTVNGSASPVLLYGVTGDIDIRTNRGDDHVWLHGDGVQVIDPLVVFDDLLVQTGAGDDTLLVEHFVQVYDDFRASSSMGQDSIEASHLMVGGRLGFSTYSALEPLNGMDSIRALQVYVKDDVHIRTSRLNDTVELTYVTMGEDLFVDTHAGNDTVDLIVNVNDQTEIMTGSGADEVEIWYSDFGLSTEHKLDLTVDLGDGDDVFGMFASTVHGIVHLKGGAGHDEANDNIATDNVFGQLWMFGFEALYTP